MKKSRYGSSNDIDHIKSGTPFVPVSSDEHRRQRLIECMPNAYLYGRMKFEKGCAVDFTHIEVNAAYEKMTGLTDLVGTTASMVFQDEGSAFQELIEKIGNVACSGGSARFKLQLDRVRRHVDIWVFSPEKEHFIALFNDVTLLRQAEEERRRGEERFRLFFEGHSAAMLIIDPETRNIIDANKAAADFYGWSAEELKQMGIQQLNTLPPGDSRNEIEKTRMSGGERFTFRHRRADASIRDVEIFSNYFRIANTLLNYVVLHDITDRIQAEEALRQSEDRFRMLFERHSAAMLVIDPNTCRIVKANEAAAAFYGWPSDQLRQMRLQDMNAISPDEATPDRDGGSCSSQNRISVRHKRADGSVRDVEIYSNDIGISTKVLRYCIIHDITDRKRYESLSAVPLRVLKVTSAYSGTELLHSGEEHSEYDKSIHTLFDKFSEPVFLIDRQGIILTANEAFIDRFGNKQEEVLGSVLYNLLPPEISDKARNKIEQVLQTGEHISFEGELKGQLYLHRVYPVTFRDGLVMQMLIFSVNITALNPSETEILENRSSYRNLLYNASYAFAYCRMIFDNGHPVDFVYEVVNRQFKIMTGFEDLEGWRISEVVPGIEKTNEELITTLGRVAMSGKGEQCELYLNPLKRFRIKAYSQQKGHFVAVLSPIHTAVTGRWEWNTRNGTMKWSEEMKMLYGLDKNLSECGFKQWIEAVAPSDRKRTEEVMRNAMSNNVAFSIECNACDSYGTKRQIMNSGFPVNIHDRNDNRYAGFCIDISGYKKENITHQFNTRNLGLLLNSSREPLCAIGIDGTIIEANKFFTEKYGDDARNLKGHDFHDLFNKDLKLNRKTNFELVFYTGEPCHFGDRTQDIAENKNHYTNNVYELSVYPVFGESEIIESIAVLITDSLEYSESEEARIRLYKQYQTLISASPDSIITTSLDGIISNVSDIGLELFGAKCESDVIGTSFSTIVYQDNIKILNDIYEVALREGLTQNREILLIKRNNNSIFSAEISVALIQDHNGAPSSYMMIIRDISERKIIESELFHAKRLISLGEMASGIAHEIFQPINNIGLIVEKLLIDSENKIDRDNIKIKSEKIFENILRVQTIIDNIRSFSSKDNNYISSVININKSIRNAFLMITAQCKKRLITIDFKPEQDRISVIGNTYKFEQVILNLINNSIDALEEKKLKTNSDFTMTIKIRSFHENDTVTITIEDNGIGISNENIEYIMHPFFTTKESGKGSGLGLSISYGIIKEMQGDIKFKSSLMTGTCATISFPNPSKSIR